MSLSFNDLVQGQTSAPPTYGQQGQLTNGPTATPNSPTSTTTITPESLTPATPAGYTQPIPTPVPDVSSLYTTPPLTPTAGEVQAQGITDRLQALNDQLVGKSAYQTQENTQFGVDNAQKTVTDLGAKLQGIQNDANAIPLLLEKASSSQGVSSGIIDKQRSSLLRDNAIQALTTSSLMSAAQGQLTNAQAQADKVVAAKYDPIQEEITAKTNNLNIILNSPEYSLEQKNRAQVQLDIQKQNQDTLDKQKQDAQNILSIATQAAANGASAQILDGITKASSPEKALTIASLSSATTPFVNQNGTFTQVSTGKSYSTPAEFFKDAGVTSFADAYSKGLVSDFNATTQSNKDFAKQAQIKYSDVYIPPNSTPQQVAQIIKGSAIYRKDTYIAPPAGGGGNTGGYIPGADPVADSWVEAVKNGNATMAQVPAGYKNQVALGLAAGTQITINSATDAQVKAIIAANPDNPKTGTGWGTAAAAINALAPGTDLASKYDAQLKAVYQNGSNVAQAFNSGNTSYSPLAASRYATASNRITSNFIQLPGFQLTANGLPYIQRIDTAIKTPGSISDQELLDAITKLSTSGNAVTDAQIKIITGGQNYADKINVFKNKLSSSGGVLSTSQRQQLVSTAHDIYDAYKKGYQPIYDQVASQLTAAGIPKPFWTIPDLNSLSAAESQPQQMNLNGKILNLQPDGTYQ